MSIFFYIEKQNEPSKKRKRKKNVSGEIEPVERKKKKKKKQQPTEINGDASLMESTDDKSISKKRKKLLVKKKKQVEINRDLTNDELKITAVEKPTAADETKENSKRSKINGKDVSQVDNETAEKVEHLVVDELNLHVNGINASETDVINKQTKKKKKKKSVNKDEVNNNKPDKTGDNKNSQSESQSKVINQLEINNKPEQSDSSQSVIDTTLNAGAGNMQHTECVEDNEELTEDVVKQKLKFGGEDEMSDSIVCSEDIQVDTDENEIEFDLKEDVATVIKKENKKKKKNSLSEIDAPRPVMSFIKTPPPKGFFRRAALKSEPAKRKTKLLTQV